MKRSIVIAVMMVCLGLAAAQPSRGEKNVTLPEAVSAAVKANFPKAEIEKVDFEKEAGIVLYDIEFKAKAGEIEVAEDGTVMDLSLVVSLKSVPPAAAEAIRKADPAAKILRVEKSEIRAELKTEGGKGQIVKLTAPKHVFEAELRKDERRGEIQVAPDGKVVEALKWAAKESEEEENEEAEAPEGKKAPDLTILPAAVTAAFRQAYPQAVITGTSKETEKGVTYYEVESVDGKLNRDLLYLTDGTAAEIEETVAPESLPAPVTEGLTKAFPRCKILKAEAVTRDGKKTFELLIQVKDKKQSVAIDPTGKILK